MSAPAAPLAALPPALARLAPPPLRVRYARVGQAGPFALPRVVLEEDWGDPWIEGDTVRFRRRTRELGPAGGPAPADGGRVVEDALVAYGPEGLCDLGTFDRAGTLSLWSPPQVVLPAAPAAGAQWSAEHRRGDETTARSVELLACTDHPGCLVSVAEMRRAGAVMVLRVHFSPGDGFGGYQALIQREGQPPIRTWTEALTVQVRPAVSAS